MKRFILLLFIIPSFIKAQDGGLNISLNYTPTFEGYMVGVGGYEDYGMFDFQVGGGEGFYSLGLAMDAAIFNWGSYEDNYVYIGIGGDAYFTDSLDYDGGYAAYASIMYRYNVIGISYSYGFQDADLPYIALDDFHKIRIVFFFWM